MSRESFAISRGNCAISREFRQNPACSAPSMGVNENWAKGEVSHADAPWALSTVGNFHADAPWAPSTGVNENRAKGADTNRASLA